MDIDEAISIAKNSMDMAHSPYNKYYVGAALKGKSRKNIFRV